MRREGWEQRLDAVLERARATPYALGRHDCLRVACAAYEALTGEDHWERFAGRYTSKGEAVKLIRLTAHDFAGAVTLVTGIEPTSIAFAQRGDIALYRDAAGEHLGICVGAHVVVLGAEGLVFVHRDNPGLVLCWRVK